MLKKLFKYEFRASARFYGPMYLLLLGVTLMFKLTAWAMESVSWMILPGTMFGMMYGLTIFALGVAALIYTVTRFYRNLIADEGYLSFTLPVTAAQHIWAKLLTAMVWVIATIAAIALSLFITTYRQGMIGSIVDDIRRSFANMHVNETVAYILLGVLLIAGIADAILKLYASMAVGQLLNGHKVLGAVLCYFGFGIAEQVLIVIGMCLTQQINPSAVLNFTNNVDGSLELIFLVIAIVVVLMLSAVYFIITNQLFRHKLNLE